MKSDMEPFFTLDQFAVFVAVVDSGGFAAASRKLNRAQSAITYAVKGLEEQSGAKLFDRSAYRPTLTDAGRTLLPRARRLLADLDDYSRHAKSISIGVEAGLTVVSDEFAPIPLIAAALSQVHQKYPSVSVKLIIDTPAAALDLLKTGHAQIGALSAQPPSVPPCKLFTGQNTIWWPLRRRHIHWRASHWSPRPIFTATCN